ncbi:hypothetical protein C7999DRAFT_28340 [Corynascus novoguineensis]|uniref:Mmc1 C-terminal domain-containing protein n=1 Tax=Corynascus novoguineensis TaxID=1126955 RepID=A0AAN7CZ16_9PEZI|nr:hypothetical protein C7999DRAFT_28340 [Corynascus novoguineensis]
MPPALALGRALSRSRSLQAQPKPSSTCLFCSLVHPFPRSTATVTRTSHLLRARQRRSLAPLISRLRERHQSTDTATTSSSPSSDPRADLHRALADLETHSPDGVSLPRLQLALRNLSEPPGRESIRVALLGVSPTDSTNGATTRKITTTRRLLRLALADPLRPPAAWEARLEETGNDAAGDGDGAGGTHPLVVRVVGTGEGGSMRGNRVEEGEGQRTILKEHVIPEFRISTPLLRGGAELEILVAEAGDALAAAAAAASGDAVDDAVLVPTVDVAATTAGHVAPIGTPVHMALLVGDGVRGAASILALPVLEGEDAILGVANFRRRLATEDVADCPLVAVNIDAASEGLELFRADVGNAMKYEALWTEANVSRISEWLRKSTLSAGDGLTKEPVRNLISSLLRSARAAVQEEETRDLAAELRTKVSPESIAHLDQALAEWAQKAHHELQQQLDAAFTTRPWSKLGWWKLVWRADDVGMVTSELVALRFLPQAEKGIIYLAGRIEEAGVMEGQQGAPLYTGPALPQTSAEHANQATIAPRVVGKWPSHIPFTRNYLQEKTVPALQALAQKLVVQSASLAGLSTALAGLSYLSAFGAYECGAIAALGIALSCRRLQQKWDAAREYWEGEVREEGRKAIRATEASVAEVLDKAGKMPDPQADQGARLEELSKVEEIIERAEEALARMK